MDVAALTALVQVLFIDLALAGDNAVVVGLAVAGLPARQQSGAILGGVVLAALIRIALAVVALRLLAITGLVLAGGLLLLWVCWRSLRELRGVRHPAGTGPAKTLRQAILQITLADVSMSLDNVLAVAGAAREHPWVLVSGLALSVALMGLAAKLVARLLERFRGLGWVALGVVLYVAVHMIWQGAHAVGIAD